MVEAFQRRFDIGPRTFGVAERTTVIGQRDRRTKWLDYRTGGAQIGQRPVPDRERFGGHLLARHVRLDESQSHAFQRLVTKRGRGVGVGLATG